MVIIFYDAEKERIYLCTERDKTKIISIDDPEIKNYIPNDDILYVQNAQFITKKQFGDWLDGNGPDLNAYSPDETHDDTEPYVESLESPSGISTQYKNSKFIHPAHNGAILITDINTPKYPNGIQLIGKYDFLCVDDVGGFEILEESMHYRYLLGKGKIEVVDYDYVKKHYGKHRTTSRADAALDAMIIKGDASGTAEAVASGRIGTEVPPGPGDAIPIWVEPGE